MKTLTSCLLVISIIFCSCKKNHDPVINVPLISRTINSFPNDPERDTSLFNYDNQGRNTDITTNTQHTVMEYNGSTVTSKTYYVDNVLEYVETYTLNVQNLAVSYACTDASGSNYSLAGMGDHEKYFYNDQGQRTKTISYNGLQVDTTLDFYENNNLTMVVLHVHNPGTPQDTSNYEYYTDQLNTIGQQNYGITFLGSSSKNLMKIMTDQMGTYKMAYEFDSQNRVTKQTISENGVNTAYIEYQYK